MQEDSPKSVQFVELFHLLFLDQMGRKISKQHYTLKGGCNLRFFLKSIRYSQDMDIDINTVRVETLKGAINRLLDSTPFQLILRAKEIELVNYSMSKQTETTQRWKMHLKLPYSSIQANTKVEFSRRSSEEFSLFESIDSTIINTYKLTPIYASHYSPEVAFRQKIWALILRTATQARDVFDLFHLLNIGVKIDCAPKEMFEKLDLAQENALSINYDAFKSQVISYLPTAYQQQYDTPELWDSMIVNVCDCLKRLPCA